MKLQAPTSKVQRSFKLQVPNSPVEVKYPGATSVPNAAFLLNDAPQENGSLRHAFDLEFGEAIIRFCKKIPQGPDNNRLIGQLVGCGTSVGANYCEANEGVSKKDFKNTIGRCVKEAKETKFFLRMVAASEPGLAVEARQLFREAKELHLIFASIYRK